MGNKIKNAPARNRTGKPKGHWSQASSSTIVARRHDYDSFNGFLKVVIEGFI